MTLLSRGLSQRRFPRLVSVGVFPSPCLLFLFLVSFFPPFSPLLVFLSLFFPTSCLSFLIFPSYLSFLIFSHFLSFFLIFPSCLPFLIFPSFCLSFPLFSFLFFSVFSFPPTFSSQRFECNKGAIFTSSSVESCSSDSSKDLCSYSSSCFSEFP